MSNNKMKRYMVVTLTDGMQSAAFFDDRDKMEDFRFAAVCGMGGEAEVYIRQDETEDECGGYEFLYS